MWSENTLCMILIILNLVMFLLGSRYGLFLFMFHGNLARICVWLFLCGVFRKCGLDSVEGVSKSSVSLLVFCLIVLSVVKVGAEVCVYSSAFVCFSLHFYWFLLRIFCGSIVECIQARIIY